MTTPADAYRFLLTELDAAMVAGDEAIADALRDRMDAPWKEMTEAERDEMRRLSVELYKQRGE